MTVVRATTKGAVHTCRQGDVDLSTPVPGSGAAGLVARRSGLSLPSLGRTLGVLYLSGGLVALLWLWLPHGDGRGDGTVLATAVLAVVLGCVLTVYAQRLVAATLHVVLGLIQVVIALGYVATEQPDSDLRLFFLWAAPYAALYFGRRAAAAHLVWTGAVASTAVVAMPGPVPPSAPAGVLLLLGTLSAGSFVVGVAASALRRAEAVQRHQASHDALTGLGNRRTLLEVLHAGPRAGATGTSALVLLDLDGFKAVNDRYGHTRGDEVLREVARRLSAVARAGDVVCRLGGDEFAVVLGGLEGEQDARACAQRIADAVSLLVTAERFDADPEDRPLPVHASTGVRLLGPGRSSPTTALREADVALYESKTDGRAVVEVWREGMRRAGEELDELSEDLRRALQEDALRLVYQPVVDAGTLRVRGVEALARWRHPVRGDVPPDVFVRCAERSGLAGELTRWVLRTGCAEARTWPVGLDGTTVNLALNISAVQLADGQIVEDVRDALAASGLRASDLVLEVTETAEVVDLDSAKRTLDALAALGPALALDDFGTGHSSLTHVQALPFHILKIDRSFTAAAAGGDRRALATIAAVGALAARLDVDVVAEGVEDARQLTDLRSLGCGFVQGYGLSRPVDAQVVRAALATPRPGGWVLDTAAVPAQRG